jgi:hypothetical protein
MLLQVLRMTGKPFPKSSPKTLYPKQIACSTNPH